MASPPRREAIDSFEEALRKGRALVERERGESAEDLAFKNDQDRNKARTELEKAQLANDNERALIGLRKVYGQNMICFLWVYFAVTFALIWWSSTDIIKLPEPVAIAMVGGTMVSVLGVVGTIVAGLFRVKPD